MIYHYKNNVLEQAEQFLNFKVLYLAKNWSTLDIFMILFQSIPIMCKKFNKSEQFLEQLFPKKMIRIQL